VLIFNIVSIHLPDKEILHPCLHIAHRNMHTGIKKCSMHKLHQIINIEKCKTSQCIPLQPWCASCLPQSAAALAVASRPLLLLPLLLQLLAVVVVLPPSRFHCCPLLLSAMVIASHWQHPLHCPIVASCLPQPILPSPLVCVIGHGIMVGNIAC
jgi:hypothetical protein